MFFLYCIYGNIIRFVSCGNFTINQVVKVKFILPELPDLAPFKFTVLSKLEGALEWEAEVSTNEIANFIKNGVVKVPKEIHWKRGSSH